MDANENENVTNRNDHRRSRTLPVYAADLDRIVHAEHIVFPVIPTPYRRLLAIFTVGRGFQAILHLTVLPLAIT